MSTKRKYHVSVAVQKSTPDYFKYRHVGLWFQPEDESTHYYFHVHGFQGNYQYEKRKNFDPTSTRSFAKKVIVAKTRHSLTSSDLARLMESVEVANSNPEFNCQMWVSAALKTLAERRFLTSDQSERGESDMVDACMEAEDENDVVV